MSFDTLGLSDALLQAVAKQGYNTPSPIQAQAIPAVLEGRDVMAAAQTGTGKTAGFTLPLLQKLSTGKKAGSNKVRALVLTPTRELAAQVHDSVSTYGQNLDLRSAVVFGGVKINPQMMKLRAGVDVLVATPGRLLDLYNQNAMRFDELEVLILDEADRMLDMGFINDIRKIMKVLPARRQNLMFSATFSNDIRDLAKTIVNDPVEVSVSPANSAKKEIKHWVHPVDKSKKTNLLIKLIKDKNWHQVLVFSRTKHGANRIVQKLEQAGIKSAAIHGNKSQGARTRALANFKDNAIQALIATDIAARGIDIDQLPQVVNFDLPNVAEDYVHRIGRTGRAGAEGQAVSLVCADELEDLVAIQRLIGELLEREIIAGFEPEVELPETTDLRPPKKKKPKKNKPQGQRRGAGQSEHRDGQRSGENARGHKPTGKNRRHTNAAKSSGAGQDEKKASNYRRNNKPSGNKPRRSYSRDEHGDINGNC